MNSSNLFKGDCPKSDILDEKDISLLNQLLGDDQGKQIRKLGRPTKALV